MPVIQEATDAVANGATSYNFGIEDVVLGSISPAGDRDWFRIDAEGQTTMLAGDFIP